VIDSDTRTDVGQQQAEESDRGIGGRLRERVRHWEETDAHRWADVLRPVMLALGGLVLALVAGTMAAVVVAGPQVLLRSASVWTSAGTEDTAATSRPVAAASLAVASPAQPTADVAPTAAATLLPASRPTTRPTAFPTAIRTPVPTAAPAPTVDQVWAATLLALDPIWSTDPPRSIAMLDDFLTRFPAYQPARDKQYAALVAYADDLSARDDLAGAGAQLTRARDLEPERGEAPAMLQALDRTTALNAVALPETLDDRSAPADPSDPGDQSDAATTLAQAVPPPPPPPPPPAPVRQAPTPRPVAPPVRVAPPPAAPAPAPAPAAPAAPPTPTKVPFLPPGG
jgi:hypothetical protein